MMLKKLAGLGFLVLLLSFPLHADHKHRSRHRGDRDGRGFIEIHVGTRHGHGFFVRDFRDDGRHYDRHRRDDRRSRRAFKKFKKQQRRYFKKHHHYHYNGRCPY